RRTRSRPRCGWCARTPRASCACPTTGCSQARAPTSWCSTPSARPTRCASRPRAAGCCGAGGWWPRRCASSASVGGRDRVVRPHDVPRVVGGLDQAQPAVRVVGVEARRVGLLLDEVEVLATVLVGGERGLELLEPLAVGAVALLVHDDPDGER